MSLPTRLSRRFAMSLVSGALLVSVAASGALAQSASPGVEPSVPVVQPTMDPVDGAVPAIPNPNIVDPQPTPWQRIEVAPDGKTLTVYFMNGAAGCNGLKDVQVSVLDGVTTVTVFRSDVHDLRRGPVPVQDTRRARRADPRRWRCLTNRAQARRAAATSAGASSPIKPSTPSARAASMSLAAVVGHAQMARSAACSAATISSVSSA
jgi:hypothetical protein